MSCTLVTAPTAYPVTLEEVKENSIIEHDDDDAKLYRLIAAATDYTENHLQRDLIQRTWSYSLDAFPYDRLYLPKSPVLSVTSVTYEDQTTSPTTNTVSTDVYGLDNGQTTAFLYRKYNQLWPDASAQHNAVTVTFVTGYAGLGSPEDPRGNIPEAIKHAIMMMVDDAIMTPGAKTDIQLYANDAYKSILAAYRNYGQ